jgi:hypothetical protein
VVEVKSAADERVADRNIAALSAGGVCRTDQQLIGGGKASGNLGFGAEVKDALR